MRHFRLWLTWIGPLALVACSSTSGTPGGGGEGALGNSGAPSTNGGSTGAPTGGGGGNGGGTTTGGTTTGSTGGRANGGGGNAANNGGGGAAPSGGASNPGGGAGAGNGGELPVGGAGDGGGGTSGGAGDGGTSNVGGGGAAGAGSTPNIPMGHAECADPPAMVITEVVSDLDQPTYVTFEPQDATRYYVTERGGTVQRIDGDTKTELLSISPNTGMGEQGLLSMAFHPNWGTGDEKRVYVGHTASSGNNAQFWEYSLDGDALVDGEMVYEFTKNDWNHNGGLALFGPDGLLYLGLGDGGGGNDPNGYGQDVTDPRASIMRFNVDDWESPPVGNRSGAGEDTRIFHWGLRNPWRFSFDLGTGDLYIGDVGQNDIEEVDIAPAGSSGLNFGWSVREGSIECPGCNAGGPDTSDFTGPIDEYPRANGGKSVTGGYVYRGSRIPDMVGRYIYADYDSGRVWIFTYDGTQMCNKVEVSADIDPEGEINGISSFGQDRNGEIYIVNYDSNPGKVFRLDPAP